MLANSDESRMILSLFANVVEGVFSGVGLVSHSPRNPTVMQPKHLRNSALPPSKICGKHNIWVRTYPTICHKLCHRKQQWLIGAIRRSSRCATLLSLNLQEEGGEINGEDREGLGLGGAGVPDRRAAARPPRDAPPQQRPQESEAGLRV